MITPQPDFETEMASFSWNTRTPKGARAACVRAQEAASLLHSDADGGFYLATRYDDVVGIMKDPATFSSAPTVFRPVSPDVPPFPVLEHDPPQHGRWRELFRELVNPRAILRLRDQVVDDITRHIDTFIEAGSCDLVNDLATFVPAETICRAVGIEDMDVAMEIRAASMAALETGGKDPDAFASRLSEFAALVVPLAEKRRAHPQADFLTRLTVAEPDGRPLGHPEIVGTLFGLLAAGHHSTTSSMSVLFADVLSRPEIRAQLAGDPKIITNVVEESLRLDPPFYGFYRRVTRPTSVANTHLAEGDSVCLSWIGANRDAAIFDEPDCFRVDRSHYRHVSFGSGIHTCLGAPLARLELQLALEQVLARMPDIQLAGPPEEKFFGGAGATYLACLPARFTPGARNR